MARFIADRFSPVVLLGALAFSMVTSLSSMAQQPSFDRAVLVTGASSGIGLRMTEVLSQNGFFVYAGARDETDLKRLDAMQNVQSVRLDVTIQSSIEAAEQTIRAEGRGLYALINNAGVSVIGPLIETPDEDMRFLMDVNLFGPYRVTKAFSDLLIESRGRVLNTSSIAGVVTGPFNGAYSMSKHGIEAFTDALSAEMERFNVEVAAVEPGNFKSNIVLSMVERMRRNGYTAENSRYGSMLDLITGPLDRSQYEEPEAVAQAALAYLTSEDPKARYMVVPNASEAALTIQQALREAVELNRDQPFAYSRDELVTMLDAALGGSRSTSDASAESARDMNIHQAALEGNIMAIRAYIEAGSDLDEKESTGGSTPLMTASVFGHSEVALALIDAGADLDVQNLDGSTALHSAAVFCHADIVTALLEAGADPSVRNASGATALDAVEAPWEAVKPMYDYFGTALGPLGLKLDDQMIQQTRPQIAELLRTR